MSTRCDELESALTHAPTVGHGGLGSPQLSATYFNTTVKPLLSAVREAADAAEQLCKKDLWPFPSYTDVVFKHHVEARK